MIKENSKSEQKYNIWLMLVATCLFTFMSTLDGSIVNIAMPVISQDLSINMNQAEWIVSLYIVVICMLLIFFGRISDTKGKIKVFRIGTVIFVIGSILCGISNSLTFLLVSRAVQAIGASMTMATNYGIITEYFPREMRGKGLGILGSFVSLGSIAGPGIGGLIIENYSWQYIFLINIPIGILAILLGYFAFPKEFKEDIKMKIDYKGFILFNISIVSLFMAIFIGQQIGFTRPTVIMLFVIFIITLILFIRIENRVDDPLIDMKLFNNFSFSLGLFCALLVFSSNLFFNVLMPFYLQKSLGFSSLTAGFILMSVPIAMMIVAPISGSLSDRMGSEILTFIGLVIVTITQFLFIFMDQSTSVPYLVSITTMTGVGVALFQSPNNSIIMSSVKPNKLGIAGSLNSLARNLGMIIGISLSTTILYLAMSHKAGFKVITYIDNMPMLFIYGMHVAFAVSFILCLIACIISAYRLFKK